MKLTIQLQLLPTSEQATLLLDTMRRVNEAASFAAEQGFAAGVFTQVGVHRLAYYDIRHRFGLSSRLTIRAIGKAVEAFTRDGTVCHVFRPDGAITYDPHNLSFKGPEHVSLDTLHGRETIGLIYGKYQAERFGRIKGQCDLICRSGKFYLLATVDFPEAPPIEVKDFIGVDLGIVNLAVDSEGETFSGEEVDRNRKRRQTARKQYQRKGTKNAKRRLRMMAGRQRRFQSHCNHTISKRLVEKAKAQSAGIALEDLKGIRSRLEGTVSRKFRRRFGNWSFFQLRSFVTYKARRAGVPIVLVDPHNTSRTCSRCGYCDKANRSDQASFRCLRCDFSTNADKNAALNLREKALGLLNESASKAVASVSSLDS
jgi:putative transposase